MYDVLNVSRVATKEDIKRSYVKLCKEHHPDVNQGNPTSNRRFIKINEAYNTLIDHKARQRYDMELYTAENYINSINNSVNFRNSDSHYTEANNFYRTTHYSKRDHGRVIISLVVLMLFATGVHSVRIRWAHKDFQRRSDQETEKNMAIYSEIRQQAMNSTVQEQLDRLNARYIKTISELK